MTATNEMLSNSKIRYNYLIGSIPEVIGELDLDGTISFVSPQVHDMLGYHPEEMIGTNIIKFIHLDDVPVIRKAIKKAIKSKEYVFPNLRLKHKRGNYILVFAKGKLLKLEDKASLIGVIKDVSKLNETEKKLEESQDIFKQLREVFLKFKEDPVFNLQLLINTAGLLLNADCALFNVLKKVNGKEIIKSLVTYNEPPNFTRESDAKGHICTDIIKDNPDDVVILSDLDKTDYVKTDENVRKYDLKQYLSFVVRFNNKPTATFCVVYTENREMSNSDIAILQILAKSASTELARWNSQKDLQKSEEKYRRLISNLTDIIIELDIKGIVTYVSPQCYNIIGYQPAEIIGKNVLEFTHPDDVMLIAEAMKQAIKTNEILTLQYYRIIHKNGDSIYVSAKGRYVNIGGNEKFIGTIRDESVRKESELKFAESENQYRSLVEGLNEVLYRMSLPDGNYEYFSPAAKFVFGYSSQDFLDNSMFIKKIMHPDFIDYFKEKWAELLKGNVPRTYEYKIIDPDNNERWIMQSNKGIFDSDGNLIAIEGLCRNITKYKNIEQEILLERDNLNNTLKSMEDGVYIADQNYDVKYVNPILANEFGPYEGKKCYSYFHDREEICPWCKNQEVFKGNTVRWEWSLEKNQKTYDLIDTPLKNIDGSVSKLEILRDITEQSLIGITIFQEGFVKYVNKAAAESIGYPLEEVEKWLIHDVFNICHSEDLPLIKEKMKKGDRNADIELEYSFRILTKLGETRWINLISKPIIYQGTQATFTITQDITDRKKAEQMLKESEEKYKSLFEQFPMAILLLNFEGVIEDCNTSTIGLFGYTKEELLGKEYLKFDIFPPDTKLMLAQSFSKFLKTGVPEQTEIQMSRKDGKLVWINSYPIVIKIAGSSYVLAMLQDITQRKTSEEQIRYQAKIIENMTEGLYLIKFDDGTIVFANPAFEEMFGYDPGEMIGKNVAIVNAPTNITPEETKNEIVGLLKNTGEWHGEVLNVKKDGTPFWCYANVSLFDHPEHGKVIVAVHTDITERKENKEEWEKFFNLSLHILIIAGFDGTILRINPGWKEILGYDETDLVGNNFMNFVHPDDREATKIEMEKLSEGSVTNYFENRYKSKDGSYRILAWSAVPNLEKNVVYSVAYDVTEQRRVEREIVESEEKLKDLIEAVPIGITMSNPMGEVFEVNSHCLKIFGYDSKEEFLNTPAKNLYPKPADKNQYMQLLKSGHVKDFEIKLKRKDGKLFWGSVSTVAKTVGDDIMFFNTVQDISQRKITEEIITDLAKFPAENPNPVLRVSKEFVLYINQAGQKLFQVTVGNRIPLSLENYIGTAFDEGNNVKSEIQLNSHIYSIFITPIEGTEYVNVYGMNITERTIAEQKLKESEENYRLITENANDIIAVLDDKFRLEYINETPLKNMLGYNSADYMGISDLLVIHPDDRKMVLNGLLKGSELGEGILDVRLKHKDGHYIWVESRGKTFFDENGEKKILINIRNITKHKKAEQNVRESEERYRILLETAVMGLVEFDVVGNKVSYINPKLLEILGYKREELLDEKIFMKIVHPEDVENLVRTSEDAYVDFRIFSKEGKLKWLSGTRNNLFDQDGKMISARLWLQDTTESKEVEKIKSNLLTRFSHEFKTPLISIKGFADFLLTEYKVNLDEKILSFLRRIKDGSNRLETLVNSFIESSQLEKAVVRVNLKQENISYLIQEVLYELEGFTGMREHTLDISLDEKLIAAIDREKIYTVISNILINAIGYTPQGGKISIKTSVDKNILTISVKDNGLGLTEEEKNRLFKPFGKIERYGKGWDIAVGGMGMGLFISKEIIELHGGKIGVESEGRNKGSTFYFSIPITQ